MDTSKQLSVDGKKCASCGGSVGKDQTRNFCQACESDYDAEWFEPCDHCDLPDACADYGCAIKNGIRKNYPIDGVF